MFGTKLMNNLQGWALLAAMLLSMPAGALPITYDIGAGTAPGFSGSWLHAGTDQMGNSGFYANGDKIRINGQLTLDVAAGSGSGVLTGSGDFGLGNDFWTILVTGASSGSYNFMGGESDIL